MDQKGMLESIEAAREDAARMMCEMIAIPAIAPEIGGDGEAKRADYLMKCLRGFDSVTRVSVPDHSNPKIMRPSILARKNGKQRGTVWIIAHTDTVPAGNLADWKTDPFKGIYQDGKVYGRGAEDNGQSVISSIIASRCIEKGTLNGMSLGLALVADEEAASQMGIVYLLDEGYFSADDIFLVPDWGSPGGRQIEINEKSLIWLDVQVIGKSTHGSTPEKGINAFRVGSQYLTDLMDTFAREFPASDPKFLPPQSTFEPTKADATVLNVNTIPGSYHFCMDIRVLPSYSVDRVLAVAKEVAARHAQASGADIRVSEMQRHVSGGESSTLTKVYVALSDAVEEVTGRRPQPVGVGGATCANFFRARGYNAYVWECGGGTLHGPNEYVVMDNLLTDAKVFATLFRQLCVEGRAH